MSKSASTDTDRNGRDRRFLPRANSGRRIEDVNTVGSIGGGEEIENSEKKAQPIIHLLVLLCISIAGVSFISMGNARYAPMLFSSAAIKNVAGTLATGSNYATFDLNINSRLLRRFHIASLRETPEIAVMGASHWQEGHANLLPERSFYNAHVHRDYYEDMLAVTEMFVSSGRLPKQLIITIRDNLFTPIGDRTDFLWMAALPDYRKMARRLGLPTHALTKTIPLPLIRERVSLALFRSNFNRWRTAPVLPHVTRSVKLDSLDILLADGSIKWSKEHDALFTRDRARKEALSFAADQRDNPPQIDPDGVHAIDTLLAFLQDQGVEVFLAHPPFNPLYYDALQGTPYMEGLEEVKVVTRDLAKKYGLKIVGGFNPHELGCGSELYIDAEHSGPQCLQNILTQYLKMDQAARSLSTPQILDVAGVGGGEVK